MTGLRGRGLRGRAVAAGAAGLFALALAATPAGAAEDAVLLTEAGVVALATAAPLPAGSPTWRSASAAQALAAACAEQPAAKVRIAVVLREPSRIEQERCRTNLGSEALVLPLGREAVALVARAGSPAMPLTPEQVFRAIGANATASTPPARWSDIDPALPPVAIMVQVPALDSPAGRIFGATVLEPGCGAMQGVRAPFGVEERLAYCSALRSPVAVARRGGRAEDVASWLQSAGPGALAVVSHAELRRIATGVSVMPISGILPTVGNVANGTYVASREIQLVIATPRAATQAARRAAAELTFALVSERSIGPAGAIAAAGMVPLAPAERVLTRERLLDTFEPGS